MSLNCGQLKKKLTVDERRQRYHCRRYIKAEDIETWDKSSQKRPKDEPAVQTDIKYAYNAEINKKLAFYHGDITSIETDGAIVNAANESCLGGGGVDGSIHSAAGDKLYQECRTLNGCDTGDAKITRGYDLPAKFIIHSVGPTSKNAKLLTSCYQRCMEVAVEHKVRTVIFCGISTGIFGYPLYEASIIALKIIRAFLEDPNNLAKFDKIIFCTFLEKERICYGKLAPIFFPFVDNNVNAEEKKTEEKKEEEEEKKPKDPME